ncbi:hypothetical protein N658DRAFT_183068 [Parathielavia hyrcaniae]|uniref:Uncharacterized protein n=1 Tax=Parathielavia hyrcaniae TaxID=113614 RepID=A0AAN6T488_9PEZI|nr:hypothetical protein N658DRAFT_183068 [Parathielavia hyrcaniae]
MASAVSASESRSADSRTPQPDLPPSNTRWLACCLCPFFRFRPSPSSAPFQPRTRPSAFFSKQSWPTDLPSVAATAHPSCSDSNQARSNSTHGAADNAQNRRRSPDLGTACGHRCIPQTQTSATWTEDNVKLTGCASVLGDGRARWYKKQKGKGNPKAHHPTPEGGWLRKSGDFTSPGAVGVRKSAVAAASRTGDLPLRRGSSRGGLQAHKPLPTRPTDLLEGALKKVSMHLIHEGRILAGAAVAVSGWGVEMKAGGVGMGWPLPGQLWTSSSHQHPSVEP